MCKLDPQQHNSPVLPSVLRALLHTHLPQEAPLSLASGPWVGQAGEEEAVGTEDALSMQAPGQS